MIAAPQLLLAAHDPAETPRLGGFGVVEPYAVVTSGSALAGLAEAVAAAERLGCCWVAYAAPGEAWAPDAFELCTPSLDLYDAMFGAASLRGEGDAVLRLTRLAFDQPERLPHALLAWWVPASHLVRTETARDMLARLPGDADILDYLFALWGGARCQKSAQPLLVLDAEPRPLDESGRERVLRRLRETPVFIPVPFGQTTYHLPYTGVNAGIEREQTRGLFFEADELNILREEIGEGAVIVDVGANTGNHTVYFAGPMRAAAVTPVEPLPQAVSALRAAVARNRLDRVDLGRLGIGVGATSGRARLTVSQRGGLGATSLTPDPAGDIRVEPLDALIGGEATFLKIDVEGMEMAVLEGAQRLIARCRPAIFIEIANRNTAAFSAWLSRNAYRPQRIFTDKGHANYLVVPRIG